METEVVVIPVDDNKFNLDLALSADKLIEYLMQHCEWKTPLSPRCYYDSEDRDFGKCWVYKVFSIVSPEFKEKGDRAKKELDEQLADCPGSYIGDGASCPMFIYGIPELEYIHDIKIEVKFTRQISLLDS